MKNPPGGTPGGSFNPFTGERWDKLPISPLRNVRLSFEKTGGLVRILIQDDGRGFDASQPASEGHFGMRIMHERAEQIGGIQAWNVIPVARQRQGNGARGTEKRQRQQHINQQ